jgi:hypothetical protein
MSIHHEDEGLPGGGIIAITATPINIDLSALEGYTVHVVCPTTDIYLCFVPDAETGTAILTTATALSATAYVADPVGATVKVRRLVSGKNTRLIARTVTGSATLIIKPIRRP